MRNTSSMASPSIVTNLQERIQQAEATLLTKEQTEIALQQEQYRRKTDIAQQEAESAQERSTLFEANLEVSLNKTPSRESDLAATS